MSKPDWPDARPAIRKRAHISPWELAILVAVAAILLFLTGQALPAELVAPKEPIAAGEYVQLGVKGVAEADLPKAKLFWWPTEKVTVIAAKTWAGEPLLMFAAKAEGRYSLWMIVPTAGGIESAQAVVVVGGAKPPDPPVPPVDPPVPPGPTPIAAGKLWLIVVLPDLTRQTPAQAAVQASAELHRLLNSRGDHLRWVDPRTAPTDVAPWVSRAEKAGLPRVLVVEAGESAGQVRDSQPLGDAVATIAMLKTWQGVK